MGMGHWEEDKEQGAGSRGERGNFYSPPAPCPLLSCFFPTPHSFRNPANIS
ncbi:hypothetical protein COO91_05156 [Nostoc flagelliforme CCNUN1]|uniref:Uncharacterized protein n=1 Tax=Nostoc flagelliforme CCNUN1 TaxID=2038116 RepID=A0A2K8SUL9_9NOSO|nr:hypothetical protein COO91_05156 [Nostoc flagelliforme CCNUN1]